MDNKIDRITSVLTGSAAKGKRMFTDNDNGKLYIRFHSLKKTLCYVVENGVCIDAFDCDDVELPLESRVPLNDNELFTMCFEAKDG